MEAETLALDALPQQLGIGLRMWILDRRDEALKAKHLPKWSNAS